MSPLLKRCPPPKLVKKHVGNLMKSYRGVNRTIRFRHQVLRGEFEALSMNESDIDSVSSKELCPL